MNAPQSIPSLIATVVALSIGAEFEGGKFAGITTLPDGKHVAVVLLPDKPAKHLPWADAMAWATEAGGQLPARPVAALLFANLKAEFEEEWHWTNEPCSWAESYACICHFDYGTQSHDHKGYYHAARAVRLIHLEV